jgi:hypothetical protein
VDEIAETCGMHGEQKCIQTFGGESWERSHMDDLCTDGRIIIKVILNGVRSCELSHLVPPGCGIYVMEYVLKNYQERWSVT